MKPQDAILAIGDKPTDGMSLYEAASLLQARALSPPCRKRLVGSPAETTIMTEGAVKGEGSTGWTPHSHWPLVGALERESFTDRVLPF